MPVWRIVVPKDGSQCARPVHVEQHRTPHHALVNATTEDLCEDHRASISFRRPVALGRDVWRMPARHGFHGCPLLLPSSVS